MDNNKKSTMSVEDIHLKMCIVSQKMLENEKNIAKLSKNPAVQEYIKAEKEKVDLQSKMEVLVNEFNKHSAEEIYKGTRIIQENYITQENHITK